MPAAEDVGMDDLGGIKLHVDPASKPKSLKDAPSKAAAVGQPKESEYLKQGCWGRIFFGFLDPMIETGHKRPLTIDDIDPISPEDSVDTNLPRFETYWKKKIAANEEPSAFNFVFTDTWVEIFWITLMAGSNSFVGIIMPYVLEAMLEWLYEEDRDPNEGFIYVGIFVGMSLVVNYLYSQGLFLSDRADMRIRGYVASAIYRKSLRVRSVAQKKDTNDKKEKTKDKQDGKEKDNFNSKSTTTGQIVNLMSGDTEKLARLPFSVSNILVVPAQLAIIIWLIHDILGDSVFAGLAMILVLIPLIGLLFVFMVKFERGRAATSDTRVKISNEVLQGIRVVKFYGWENNFMKHILAVRDAEVNWIFKSTFLSTGWGVIFILFPLALITTTFTVYVNNGGIMTVVLVYKALSLFNALTWPLISLPESIASMLMCTVASGRISKFLCQPELADDVLLKPKTDAERKDHAEYPIQVNNASFSWSDAEVVENGTDEAKQKALEEQNAGFTLDNINIKIKKGSLTAIVGEVASGKSSLMAALLGEMNQTEGTMVRNGSLAYVAHESWIQNGTVKDNILFGSKYDADEYNQTINVCAFRDDLNSFPAKDATEIGVRGINLSGGQKQRVALCRAVYKNADMYLFDDPLSAVDANVGHHIFYQCINGMLRKKTRVLVTNQVHYLNQCDYIYYMDHGHVSEHGTFADLMAKDNSRVQKLINSYLTNLNMERDVPIQLSDLISTGEDERKKFQSEDREEETKSSDHFDEKRQGEMMLKDIGDGGNILSEEEMFEGRVNRWTYMHHLRSLGGWRYLPFFFVAVILTQIISVYPTFLFGMWGKHRWQGEHKTDQFFATVIAYCMLGVGLALSMRGLAWANSVAHSGRLYHRRVLNSILHAPNTFFDTTPVGRVLNRFSMDLNGIDTALPMAFLFVIVMTSVVLGSLMAVASVTPTFTIAVVVAMFLFVIVQSRYAPTAVSLQRIEAVTRSPVFDHFTETLRGLSTIRAFSVGDRFVIDNSTRVNSYIQTVFIHKVLFHWMRLRTSLLQGALVGVGSMLIVLNPDAITPNAAGASLVFVLSFGGLLNFLVMQLTELQSRLNVVERLAYYSEEIDREPEWRTDADLSAEKWPTQGTVTFKNVSMKYRPELDNAIRKLNFSIKSGEKIGVAGRTGSGKSSVMLTLLRMYELSGGTIEVDGVDIKQIGLHALRDGVSIIPQDPIVFSGTIRGNLDPFNDHTDHDIWSALSDVKLKEYVQDSMENGLESEVLEYGSNLSAGQRQLICIARIILKKPKILLMDEATSSIDQHTDDLVQELIREKFAESTVITIAHRLNTIMDSDRILILDDGELVEYDAPSTLVMKPNGVFAQMYNKSAGGASSQSEETPESKTQTTE